MKRITKYAAEMGSGAMIYITIFIKSGSGIQKSKGRNSQSHKQHGYHISLLLESRLKKSSRNY
jgi:hypothetical protein